MSRATEPIFNPADFNGRLMFGVVVFARRRVGVVLVDRDFLAGAMMTGQLLFQIKGSGPIFMKSGLDAESPSSAPTRETVQCSKLSSTKSESRSLITSCKKSKAVRR
jgi:hypothetical protein